MKAKKILIAIDILLIVLTVIFILSNSAASSEKSNSTSQSVTDKVVENVKPIQDAISQDKVDEEQIHKYVRKTAHILEYALLGAELMILLILTVPNNPMKYLIYILFFGLALGVCDETVQKFTERTSSTTDVIRDFGGICLGVAAAYLISVAIAAVGKKIKQRRTRADA